ncbi:MAG: hypothetical protein QMD92_01850 [bacterium]|nr:hypothetical protein [bacterium]
MLKKYSIFLFLCVVFLLSFSSYKKSNKEYPIKIITNNAKINFLGNEYLDNELKFKINLPLKYIKDKKQLNSVFFKDIQNSKNTISIIFWEKDQDTYEYYVEAFKNKTIPKSFFMGLLTEDKVLSIKEIKREDTKAYLFNTKKGRLFITRVEIFPYQKDLQITIVSINTKYSEKEVLNIFSSFKLLY